MRLVGSNPAAQLQKLRRRMLVGRHRRAEGQETEILQNIVQFVKCGVARQPERIPLGKEVGREAAQA